MPYLLLITFAMCVAYGVLWFLFPIFFRTKIQSFSVRSFYSLIYIVVISLAAYAISAMISDPNLGNRIVHAFGGGFLAFFVCYRVAKDSKLPITRFQFFLFSFLLVMALGIANEMLEFYFQTFFQATFSTTVTDTWLDLLSNLIGALIAGGVTTPFIGRESKLG